MGKKMKLLPSLSKSYSSSSSLWQWPSCKHPKTHSFRAGDDIFKTVNSVYFDAATAAASSPTPSSGGHEVMLSSSTATATPTTTTTTTTTTATTTTTTTTATPESWFTNSSEESGAGSFSTVSESLESGEESLEMVIRGLRSERLFFEPGNTNSILEEAKMSVGFPYKESLVMAMESEDPYVDFRTSMEEMVEAHGLKDWDCLEELLSWYLRANGKKNHGFIVGAFVDLLVGIAAAAAAVASSSSSSKAASAVPCCASSSSDSCSVSLCSLEEEEEKVKEVCCLEISEI